MNIQEYCDTLDLQLIVRYYPNQTGRWAASIERAEFKDSRGSSVVGSLHGAGKTPHAAVEDLAKQMPGKVLVVDGMTPRRRDFDVPTSLTGMPQMFHVEQ